MKIFTKRNALVGYLVLRAASRGYMRVVPMRRSRRAPWKLGVLLALGVVSVGLVLVLAALRRHRTSHEEPHRLEGYAVADEVALRAAAESVLEPPNAAA